MNDDRLGPYRLLRRLGEGGMGVVHLAVDQHGRQVAVKVLRSEVAGDEVARRRLSREVETMRRVRSKYIAEVLDADVTGHRPYIVTRYVAGRALDEIVKDDGPLELPALLTVAHGVASALAAVHSVGVIHRDLKPGNVLILDGQPVLIDFGIAQAVDATRLTQTGMFIGTPGYLAPEIIEGSEAGPEVDVHAWAGTILYAGTGQPPFGKGTLEMIFYNITAGKADVSAAPPVLQPLLKAAFQRNPAKRPKAAELAEQTARLMPKSTRMIPDEISTVPRTDQSGTGDIPTPIHQHPPAQQYVSLLPDGSGPLRPGGQGTAPPFQNPAPPAQGTAPPFPQPTPGQQGTQPGPAQQGTPPGPGQQGTQPGPGQQGGPSSPGQPVPGQQGTQPATGQPASGPQGAPPAAGRHGTQPGQSQNPAPGQGSGPHAPGSYQRGPDQGYQAPSQGDPWPTRRVTSEELRQMQEGPSVPWPGQGQGQQGWNNSHGYAPAPREGDVPTKRVRPEAPPPYVPVQAPPQPQQYAQDPVTRREPYIPGARPGQMLQRSKAYGVAGAMLLVIMIVLAALAPVLVAVVAIPVALLLRAADLAQSELVSRRSTGAAALDVLRVFAHPKALVKSAGITLALVLYAAILGLPVTLLLTVLGQSTPENALAWGAAVAIWTICAGPGVEGPGRQMRRTLASLVPSRTAAMVMAGVFAAGAALSLVLAVGTFTTKPTLRAVWSPVDVQPLRQQLNELKKPGG
ncbi:serine/threonine-protein kinase [Nonomuraea typhae]|uniref:serine/threonine-protein kinase n=1 Tax=Nonomuraea typhae TaxID=2603600 RepID=UPI0015E2429E|nr:serine/threonine-protein kinase [Nonomuraea typhae]